MSLIGRKPPSRFDVDPLGYWSKPKPAPTLGAYMAGPTAEIRPVKVEGGYVPSRSVMAPFPGPRTPAQLRSVRKASASARIVAPAVHPKYGPAKYGLHTIVVPGKRVTIYGVLPAGHRYVGPRPGDVNTRPMQIRRVFRMGDAALTHGYNLDYIGRIRGITAKQIKVVEHEAMGTGRDKVYHLSLYDFADKNWNFDEEKSRKRNAEWTD